VAKEVELSKTDATVALFKKFDEGHANFEGSATKEEEAKKVVQVNRLPLVSETEAKELKSADELKDCNGLTKVVVIIWQGVSRGGGGIRIGVRGSHFCEFRGW